MPAKIARLATRPLFWIPEVSVAVRTSRLSCRKAGKAPIFMSDRQSSGESRFKSFAETFGHLIVLTKTLPALCKYGGANRTGLYNLGFTDQDIDSKNMGDLAVELIAALKNLADKTGR